MSAGSHEIRGARRSAVRWTGLTAFILLAACGGERRESATAGTEGAAATDSMPTASADTVAMTTGDSTASTATDTSTATRDTTVKQTQRPTAPAQAKPAKPAAPARDTGAKSQENAAPAQDTAATTQADSGTGKTQTAEGPLRDQYHQAPKDTVDQATYDGWKQFNLNCARCHGEDVLGSTIAPHLIMSLKPDGPINTPELFTQTVCAGRPEKGMPSWCALGMDPAKINQIYLYVKGRSDGKIHPGRPAVKPEG
jgi:mono/diheme cytochrome c family protein